MGSFFFWAALMVFIAVNPGHHSDKTASATTPDKVATATHDKAASAGADKVADAK